MLPPHTHTLCIVFPLKVDGFFSEHNALKFGTKKNTNKKKKWNFLYLYAEYWKLLDYSDLANEKKEACSPHFLTFVHKEKSTQLNFDGDKWFLMDLKNNTISY